MSTDLVVLDQVFPLAVREDVDELLVIDENGQRVPDHAQINKLAMIAGELEGYRKSPLLAAVPANAVECHKVADIIKGCAAGMAEMERSRKARTAPLNDQVKRINAVYAVITEALEDIRKRADRLVIAHNQAERARVQREQEEQRRRQAEAAALEAEAIAKAESAKTEKARQAAMAEAEVASRAIAEAQVAEPEVAPRAYRNDVGTVSIRKTWVVAGFDPDKIPASYYRHEKVLEVVRKLLEAAVRAGARDIPGCAIEEKESTSARG